MSADELVVRPWRRYGRDRLYVQTSDGSSLGFLDRTTGEVHVQDEADRTRVSRAVGVDVPMPEIPPYAVTVERIARDLGDNRAGGGAQEKATELRSGKSLLARVLGVHTDERAWRVGAKGERWVGEELDRLTGRGWTVVHDVPVGERGANIDHVLVGPGGVFTVNSKWHVGKNVWCGGDTVMVSGQKVDYVRKARWEAQRAAKLLSKAFGEQVAVTGMIVIVTDRWTQKSPPVDVLVMKARQARKHLEELPVRYAVHEVDRLALWARRDTTWQPTRSD